MTTGTPAHDASTGALPHGASWAALHTQPRAEKVVARYLEGRGIPHWLPLVRSRRTYGARVRLSWHPLFPGYVFYDAEAATDAVVYASRKVARILRPTAPAELETDLANLAATLALTPDLARAEIHEPGAPVEVVSGPYRGVRGELVRRKGATLLVLRVRFLRYAAEMAIDEAWVRPVESDS